MVMDQCKERENLIERYHMCVCVCVCVGRRIQTVCGQLLMFAWFSDLLPNICTQFNSESPPPNEPPYITRRHRLYLTEALLALNGEKGSVFTAQCGTTENL